MLPRDSDHCATHTANRCVRSGKSLVMVASAMQRARNVSRLSFGCGVGSGMIILHDAAYHAASIAQGVLMAVVLLADHAACLQLQEPRCSSQRLRGADELGSAHVRHLSVQVAVHTDNLDVQAVEYHQTCDRVVRSSRSRLYKSDRPSALHSTRSSQPRYSHATLGASLG